MGALKLGLVAVVLVVLGFAAYVRLAPSDPVRWHDDPVAGQGPKDWGGTPEPLGQGAVMLTQLGSARSFSQHTLAPADLLARLDAIAGQCAIGPYHLGDAFGTVGVSRLHYRDSDRGA
jgi:hypothetical protein